MITDNDKESDVEIKTTIQTENVFDEDGNNDITNFKYKYLLKKGISNVRGGIKVLCDMNYPTEIIEESKKL